MECKAPRRWNQELLILELLIQILMGENLTDSTLVNVHSHTINWSHKKEVM